MHWFALNWQAVGQRTIDYTVCGIWIQIKTSFFTDTACLLLLTEVTAPPRFTDIH